jgi:hypothetical protein
MPAYDVTAGYKVHNCSARLPGKACRAVWVISDRNNFIKNHATSSSPIVAEMYRV